MTDVQPPIQQPDAGPAKKTADDHSGKKPFRRNFRRKKSAAEQETKSDNDVATSATEKGAGRPAKNRTRKNAKKDKVADDTAGTSKSASAPNLKSEDASKSEKSASDAKKSRRNRKKAKAVENKEKTVSDVEQKVSLDNRAVGSLSADGIALIENLRARGFSQQVRTGRIPMSALLGERPQASQSGEALGRAILKKLGGDSVDPHGMLSATLRQMPQIPGFPSFGSPPDTGAYSSIFRPELFNTSMGAMNSAVRRQSKDFVYELRDRLPSGAQQSANFPFSPLDASRFLPQLQFSNMFPFANNRRAPSPSNLAGLFGGSSDVGGMNNRGRSHNLPQGHNSQHGHNGHQGGNRNYQNQQYSGSGSQQNYYNRSTPQQHRMHSNGNHTPNDQGMHHNNQKTRKPLFMPYLAQEAVARGLSSKDLIKGALRVNQRNYEESYIDNPEGDDQLDLLILGIHDRNRALHGDVVVVRVKDRENWVVRDNLYQAWRNGQLHVEKDDNGQPLTIPPVQPADEDDLVEVAIGGLSDMKIKRSELEAPVPTTSEKKYDRNTMIVIGAQVHRIHGSNSQEKPVDVDQSKDAQNLIDDLSIARQADAPVTPPSAGRKSPPQKPRVLQQANGKKSTHRLLCEMPDEDWGVPDVCLQKTAEVVYIAEQKNCRAAMGLLKPMNDGNSKWALFSPTDSRMPRMMIPADQLPTGFFDRPQDFSKFVFVSRMVEWNAQALFARGKLERRLGLAGDIEVETEGLLFSNNVDTREFSSSALSSLPITESKQWSINEKEFKYRLDLREEIIFTIDPKTARDLDDALSIKPIEDVDGKGKPGYEIGVHIADVTHFLQENTELDSWAASRATSVYLVHKVIPMLPRILCEELCSLNPAVDRLTFSVIFKMDAEGNVYDEWFGRTIIRSKVKLAYEHAQDFIDNPEKDFADNEIPPVCDGVAISTIKQKVLLLHSVAVNMRAARARNGALRLDQPKLKFALDDETHMPNGLSIYEIKQSNNLVEEFMLLANMAVARKIESHFPKTAILRRHPPPKQKVLREMLEICEKIGFPLDATSSGLLSSSLNKYMGSEQLKRSINQVLSMFMMKPMQLALYFCTGTVKSKSDYHHYALNAPFYTHFTSPIRRYADVMVHRLLAASLGYSPAPDRTIQELEKQAVHCNDKKTSAKAVSDASDETFFGLFVQQCGPIETLGVVVNVLDASFDVLLFKYGVIKRVYVNRLDMARDPTFMDGPPAQLNLYWNGPEGRGQNNAAVEQKIRLCSVVEVVLSALPEPTKYQAVIRCKETKTLLELEKAGVAIDL